jgi:hypothetical protein
MGEGAHCPVWRQSGPGHPHRGGRRSSLRHLPCHVTSSPGGGIQAASLAFLVYSGTSGAGGEVEAEAASNPGGGIEATSLALHTYSGTSGPGREIEATCTALLTLSPLAQVGE